MKVLSQALLSTVLLSSSSAFVPASTKKVPSCRSPFRMASLTEEEVITTQTQTTDSNGDMMTTTPTTLAASAPTKVRTIDVLASMAIGGTNKEYQRGLITIGAITLLFASNSPALHAVFTQASPPPVLLVNSAISAVALTGLLFGGSVLESSTPLPSTLIEEDESVAIRAGLELGFWKFLGTTANIAGLSLTTANHGAFLIQLTTLIVPVVQGIMGVPIPRRIQFAVLLALCGVALFTQDVSESASHASASGDALCVVAAAFYATYDLRLFSWGKRVAPRTLITGKIATQALLSMLLLAAFGYQDTVDYAATLSSSPEQLKLLIPIILWSGVAVNAVAPYLQVGGQQAVGPTRCQTIYASQPLWAGIMSFVFLGETVGMQGLAGGLAFLSALFLAATSEAPDPDCGEATCEV